MESPYQHFLPSLGWYGSQHPTNLQVSMSFVSTSKKFLSLDELHSQFPWNISVSISLSMDIFSLVIDTQIFSVLVSSLRLRHFHFCPRSRHWDTSFQSQSCHWDLDIFSLGLGLQIWFCWSLVEWGESQVTTVSNLDLSCIELGIFDCWVWVGYWQTQWSGIQ